MDKIAVVVFIIMFGGAGLLAGIIATPFICERIAWWNCPCALNCHSNPNCLTFAPYLIAVSFILMGFYDIFFKTRGLSNA